jgi:rhomboid protease GluP
MPFDNRSAASIREVFAQAWTRMPVTVVLIAAVVGLHVVQMGWPLFGDGGKRGVTGALGGVVDLSLFLPEKPGDPNSPLVPVKQLYGPFDLWDGQLWRIPVSGLLHANLFHLATNLLAFWALGGLLEPRMRRGWYLAFFFSALTVSMVPEFLLEHYAVGISGALCAMLGMLLPMRKHSWQLREVLSDNAVRITLAILVAGIPLTAFDIIPIANVAHFSGLFYGWIAGLVFFGALSARHLWKGAFFAAHLVIPVALYATMHPTWNGRYYWYEAHRAAVTGRWNVYEGDLKQAVQLDPGLVECWNDLARYQGHQGQYLEAWRTTVKGLGYNRSNDKGVELARDLFARIPTAEGRADALRILDETFGDEAKNWQARLTRGVPTSPVLPALLRSLLPSAPRFDPDAPDSAAEGRST